MKHESEHVVTANMPGTRSPSIEYEPRELTFRTGVPVPIPASPNYPAPPEPIVDPFDWSRRRKAFTTIFCCLLSALSGYATGSANSTIAQQGAVWGLSETIMLLGTTTYAFAFAFSPMLIAPFSEVRGRKPVFITSGFLLAISSMGCGLASSFAGFLVGRFFTGLWSSTFSTMVGGIVTDMYHNEDRNTPMAIFAAACFVGTGMGPLISNIIVYHVADWRWDYYVQAIVVAALSIASIFLVSETRQNVLLSVRAQRLNKWQQECVELGMQEIDLRTNRGSVSSEETDVENGNIEKEGVSPSVSVKGERVRLPHWYVSGEDENPPILRSIRISLARAFHLLLTEPIVFWFSMWIAFAWAVLYLALPGIPITFDGAYAFNEQQTGAVYTAIPVAAILGCTTHIIQDKFFAKHDKLVPQEPEARLRFATWESLLFPIGLFWWGWTCRPEVPWIVPTLGVGCAFMGVYTIFLAVLNYTADSYHRLASSALAAQSLTRNILGATIPLASSRMFASLGSGGALSLIGGVALLLSAVPVLLLFFGPRIRARSKIASEIMDKAK